MTVRELIRKLIVNGELDSLVVISTCNGDYNIASVENGFDGDDIICLCIDE